MSKSQTHYNAPWWKLILSTKMCQQKCARHILLSYTHARLILKFNLRHIFYFFFTFLQILSFLLNLAPALGGIQSKRLRTTHFFSGGGLDKLKFSGVVDTLSRWSADDKNSSTLWSFKNPSVQCDFQSEIIQKHKTLITLDWGL